VAEKTVRCVVVEDHPLYRDAVVALVSRMDGWQVTGAYGDAESAVEAVADADLVVLDLGLPGIDGIDAIRVFTRANADVAVVVLTMSEEPTVLTAALRAGARGYLVKGSEPEDIERALVSAVRGQAVFGEQVAAALLAQAAAPRRTRQTAFPSLTERELDVLDLLSSGRSNAEIAAALFISPKTARNLVSSVLTKLSCSRPEAVARGRDAGLGRDL
jgi:DNA-binding NarL/FixJ family response regulator